MSRKTMRRKKNTYRRKTIRKQNRMRGGNGAVTIAEKMERFPGCTIHELLQDWDQDHEHPVSPCRLISARRSNYQVKKVDTSKKSFGLWKTVNLRNTPKNRRDNIYTRLDNDKTHYVLVLPYWNESVRDAWRKFHKVKAVLKDASGTDPTIEVFEEPKWIKGDALMDHSPTKWDDFSCDSRGRRGRTARRACNENLARKKLGAVRAREFDPMMLMGNAIHAEGEINPALSGAVDPTSEAGELELNPVLLDAAPQREQETKAAVD